MPIVFAKPVTKPLSDAEYQALKVKHWHDAKEEEEIERQWYEKRGQGGDC